ncbi:unnamed protein product [Camellia sinensis]
MFLLLSSADEISGKMTNSKGTLVIGYNSSERTPATELIGSNVDILTEILTRVPAKFVIRFKIDDSCKGLLLCLNGPTCFIVCNLTTQKYTVLPYHSGTKASSLPFHNKFGVFLSSMFGGYLAFDPSKSPHYKVVLLSYIRNSDGCFDLIDIYSLESTSWTHMRAAAPPA